MKATLVCGCSLVLLIGCGREPEKARISLQLENITSNMISAASADAGKGIVDLGLIGPRASSEYGDFPSLVGAELHVQWEFEGGGKTRVATNVLGRGIRKGEEIKVLLEDDTARVVPRWSSTNGN